MRSPAGFAHRRDLVVERAPVAAEHVSAGDDDVDLTRALGHSVADLLEPLLQGREPRGKAGRDRSDRNPRALERPDRGGDHGRIDADRSDRKPEIGNVERGENLVAQRAARLGAEPAHALGRVVARERRQVDASHRLHEPGGLVFLLDRAAGGQRRGPSFDRAGVDADTLEPVGRERDARIAGPVVPGQSRIGECLVHGASLTSASGAQRVTNAPPNSSCGRGLSVAASAPARPKPART